MAPKPPETILRRGCGIGSRGSYDGAGGSMTIQRVRVGLVLCSFLAAAGIALASHAPCTIHPKKGASKAELTSLAKVSEDDARKTALASLKDPSKGTVKESELESERGCLVYSFDIAIS